MRIELTVEEAVTLAGAVRPLPPLVLDVRPTGEDGAAVEVDLDGTLLPGASGLLRLGAALAGRVTVTARFAGFTDGDATVALAAHARGLTVDRLLNHLTGAITDALAAQGLPPELVELRRTPEGPQLVVHVQAAADARARGVGVRSVELFGGRLTVLLRLADEVRLS